MTTVCLVGAEEINLQYELLSRETARDALTAYDLGEPFANSVAVDTVSIGAAVSLLNDLDWYLVRFVETALVFEPSVSEVEWLSRGLAEAIRDERIDPAESGRFLKVFGVVEPDSGEGSFETGGERGPGTDTEGGDSGTDREDSPAKSREKAPEPAGSDGGGSGGDTDTGHGGESTAGPGATDAPPRLVEPMYVARTGESLPEYDLRDVDDTLVVRVTESEFEQ